MFQPTALPECEAGAGAAAAVAAWLEHAAIKAAASVATMRESFTEPDLCKSSSFHALPTSEKPLEDMRYVPCKPTACRLYM
jgi:hypothetical protein